MKAAHLSAGGCRWIARIVGTFAVVAVVIMLIGEGMPNPFAQPALAQVGFAGVALIVTGMLIGWRWELAGGILSLVGVCLIYQPTRVYGKITRFFAVLAAPGSPYLTSHLLRSYAPRRSKTQPREL